MVDLFFSPNEDDVYLRDLSEGLTSAFDRFKPDLIVFNAGTDIMEGDPLGHLSISAKGYFFEDGLGLTALGVAQRDQLVFGHALKRKIPICMVLSGNN